MRSLSIDKKFEYLSMGAMVTGIIIMVIFGLMIYNQNQDFIFRHLLMPNAAVMLWWISSVIENRILLLKLSDKSGIN